MTDEFTEKRLEVQINRVLKRLMHFFTPEKAEAWLNAENPSLGGVSPIQMIYSGRTRNLERFIEDSLAENP